MWRFYQLEKHLSSPEHPYHKFGTGSLETLWTTPKSQDRDPRAELIEWWKKEYCASRMKLVVLGKEDLDTLEGWVRERFEKVEYKGKEKVMYSDKVFEEGQMGVSLSVVLGGSLLRLLICYISRRDRLRSTLSLSTPSRIPEAWRSPSRSRISDTFTSRNPPRTSPTFWVTRGPDRSCPT